MNRSNAPPALRRREFLTARAAVTGGPSLGWAAPAAAESVPPMTAAALLPEKHRSTDADIDAPISNLWRCGTYPHLRKSIRRASATA
jgi:hypothetical protein